MLILLFSDSLRSKEIPHFLKRLRGHLCSDSLPATPYSPTWSEELTCLMQSVFFQHTTANFVFEVVQGPVRVLNIKKTRKTRGGLITG